MLMEMEDDKSVEKVEKNENEKSKFKENHYFPAMIE